MLKNNLVRTNLYRKIEKRPELLAFLKGDLPLDNLFDLLSELPKERRKLYQILYKGIGNTPIYELLLPNNNKLHIKLECENANGNNHYSRYWLIHLALAEAFEIITPYYSKIAEVTSGSSGISLSLAVQALGYSLTMIVPDKLPAGRINPMLEAGTTIIKVNGYIDVCIEKLKEVLQQEEYYAANHSEEKSNLITYVFSRIASEYMESNARPDIAILGLGNGTSTEAVAGRFKKDSDTTKVYAYYPSLDSKQVIFGLYGPKVSLRHIDSATQLVDTMFYTSDYDIEEVKAQFQNDNVISNLGISSIYAVKFALLLAEKIENKTMFSIGYDNINRYSND